MPELFDLIDSVWTRVDQKLSESFTTQAFRDVIVHEAPDVWAVLVERYGPGGAGTGNFYSPNNILFNYLRDKAWKAVLVQTGFVPASQGWGTSKVMGWQKVTDTAVVPPTEEDIDSVEGKGRLRTHFVRERAPGVRRKLINRREKTGLSCDVCDATGSELDGDVRAAMFEAHHATAPLLDGERTTKLSHMALLCACCHRLIHRLVSVHERWITVSEARELLGAKR
ncbi:hypothetical protein BLJAPNOD_01266 [Ensifer sp. M14]|uniref:HNH endonuclease n=1 Tax=Ensifer sp. M14 TaxID=2203782 RepID=UPI000E2BBBCB|nr:hypothetical protein [Ensifer sp. M14]RDL50148.1 hypothetical protein BLJAPNOD_01266 [Ensifer sp. M14]